MPKICPWAKYQNRHSSKIMSDQAVLLPKRFPHQRIILAKGQFDQSYTFCTMPILILSPGANFGHHPLCTLEAQITGGPE